MGQMADQISVENVPEPERLDPLFIGRIFVKQYYGILEKSPTIVHKFYTDQSVVDRPGPDGVMTYVTTMEVIRDTIMSSDYKGCLAEILSVDAQESLDGGVIVVVNGYFIGEDSLKRGFYQTFFLARQEKGFFVLNDMLRFIDAHGTLTPAAGSETEKSSLIVHLNQTPVDIAGQAEPTNGCAVEDDTKKLSDVKDLQSSDSPIQNEVKDSQSSDAPIQNVVKDSQSSDAPIQNVVKDSLSSYAPTHNKVKVSQSADAPILNEARSSDAPIQNEAKDSQSSDAPIQNDAKDSQSSDAPIQNGVTPMKSSYASMVAKQTKVASPTHTSAPVVLRVSPTADQQPKASPKLKSPLVSVDKDFNSSNNSTENSSFNGDDVAARTIYVGNLPSNYTKSGLLNAVNVFGSVKKGSIQLRTYDDGFCFGFVEFESAASTRKAIAARNIVVGDNNAYITYKRSTARYPDNIRVFRAGNFKGQDSGDWVTKGSQQSDNGHNVRGFSRVNGESNPSGGFGRESYRTRNDARLSNGEGYQRNNQRRFGGTTQSFGSQ